jgi:SRSO17 transposase
MRDYCVRLLMPIERKSVEPMAAVTAPAQVAAKHQSLLHFVGNAPWSDAAMLARVGQLVLPAIERSGPIEAWFLRSGRRKFCRAVARSRKVEEVGFAVDSPLEGDSSNRTPLASIPVNSCLLTTCNY